MSKQVLRGSSGRAWCAESARKVIAAYVDRNLGLFRHFPDLSRDDLIQECMVLAPVWHRSFDASRAAYSTWINQCARFRLLTVYRGRSRQARREAVRAICEYAGVEDGPAGVMASGWDGDGVDDHETLEDWLGSIYRKAKWALPEEIRRGPKGYSLARIIAVAMLMWRLNQTIRGTQAIMGRRPELLAAVRLKAVPGRWWFHRCAKYRTQIRRRAAGIGLEANYRAEANNRGDEREAFDRASGLAGGVPRRAG